MYTVDGKKLKIVATTDKGYDILYPNEFDQKLIDNRKLKGIKAVYIGKNGRIVSRGLVKDKKLVYVTKSLKQLATMLDLLWKKVIK